MLLLACPLIVSERQGDARDAITDVNQMLTQCEDSTYPCALHMHKSMNFLKQTNFHYYVFVFMLRVIITLNLEYTTDDAQREAVQTSIHIH